MLVSKSSLYPVQLQDAGSPAYKRYTYEVTLMCTRGSVPRTPQAFLGAGAYSARLYSAFALAFWCDAQASFRFGSSLRRWASAALRPKSAFICVGLNLDHNSTPATWA